MMQLPVIPLLCLAIFGVFQADSYCEVKGNNFAPEGKPSQISLYHVNGNASNAIDGNRNGLYRGKSCVLTKSEESAWWRVDFRKSRKVGAVLVVNREDACCWKRLKGAEIRVGNDPHNRNPVCGTISDPQPGAATTLCCGGMVGRYVSVVIPGREEILNFCELEVYPEGIEKPCI
ncbi:fucolectin-like [Hyperolius riggenbachi]|uniref:fucolectin-like n=1 Tax=Hyperolius riggenbachi TaxID=752182 RepID=UPI0035A374E7